MGDRFPVPMTASARQARSLAIWWPCLQEVLASLMQVAAAMLGAGRLYDAMATGRCRNPTSIAESAGWYGRMGCRGAVDLHLSSLGSRYDVVAGLLEDKTSRTRHRLPSGAQEGSLHPGPGQQVSFQGALRQRLKPGPVPRCAFVRFS
jgi:hypothetical protein